jgi:Ca-activated chloride channel family protein
MTTSLNLTCSLSSKVIPAGDGSRLVYLLIDITGGESVDAIPSNLGFVIDTSESMRIRLVTDEQFADLVKKGQAQEVMTDGVPAYQITAISDEQVARFPRRIDYVVDALIVASEYLRPVDYFSVVAFAGWAHKMIPSVSGKERARLKQAAREMEYLRLGEGTQMAEGLALAFSEIQSQSSKEYASRMILLTDGHTLNVNECYEWARKARENGYKLSTMGIGAEFNEDLLIPLADQTNGNAYYIESPDKIPEVFQKELGAALRISYRNVEVKLQLSNSVELRRVYRALPEINAFDQGPNLGGGDPDSSYSLLVGDYDPAAPVALLLELVIPPMSVGDYRLAQALLAWERPITESTQSAESTQFAESTQSSGSTGLTDNAGSTESTPPDKFERTNLRQEVIARISSVETARLNERVMNIVEKVGAFKMGSLALEEAQSAARSTNADEKGAATIRLRQAATRLLDLGEATLADTMLLQADALESSGSIDPEATKKLRYETRRIAQH